MTPTTTTPKKRKAPAKGGTHRRGASKKRTSGTNPLTWVWIVLGVASLLFCIWMLGLEGYRGSAPVRVVIPAGSSPSAVADTLRSATGSMYGRRTYLLWKLQGGNAETAHGSYEVAPGQSALSLARRIAGGRQTPVKLTFNNIRTIDMLSQRVAAQAEMSPEEFKDGLESVLGSRGWTKPQFPAAMLPDSYEIYWTATPQQVAEMLLKHRDAFWTDQRRSRADALGLTPVEVATLASIVEEETAKADERPKVARLYLNRLAKGMKLQADPTVKFAVGDFSLRRILHSHLAVQSPYNTYLHKGLPPGPIRIPTAATLDAVLDAPSHPYLFMCAKSDFSGYHDFAVDYATHQANARRYQQALNKRGIK